MGYLYSNKRGENCTLPEVFFRFYLAESPTITHMCSTYIQQSDSASKSWKRDFAKGHAHHKHKFNTRITCELIVSSSRKQIHEDMMNQQETVLSACMHMTVRKISALFSRYEITDDNFYTCQGVGAQLKFYFSFPFGMESQDFQEKVVRIRIKQSILVCRGGY